MDSSIVNTQRLQILRLQFSEDEKQFKLSHKNPWQKHVNDNESEYNTDFQLISIHFFTVIINFQLQKMIVALNYILLAARLT